jgi:hypothetical protein
MEESKERIRKIKTEERYEESEERTIGIKWKMEVITETEKGRQ